MENYEHKDYFYGRWCFHGDEDKVVNILDSYAQKQVDLSNVNNVFQLYHTKLFFDRLSEVFNWDEEKYNFYKELASYSVNEIRLYFELIDENNLVDIYNNCYVAYRDDFWSFFCKFKTYEKISREKFIPIVKAMRLSPYKLFENRVFVKWFDIELTEVLKEPNYSARLLVDYYLKKHTKPLEVHLPKSLTSDIKYKIISDYIDGKHANGNLLNLIMNGKNSKEFPIDDKLRLKAKKRFEKLWEDSSIHMITSY